MRIHLSLISVLLSLVAASQIVDDSTKLVYGPKTTEFTNEFNILNNLDDYQRVDTSIYLFERQSLVDKTGRTFQSLGNFGTALFPVFYTPQNSIGRTSGFNAYSAFQIDPSEIKYYDTKSPFIEIFTYLGGGNRNLVNVGFSRNVNEDWNIGFDLKTITTNKQLAPANQTDRQVIGTSFVAYSHYKKKKYQALLNFSSMSHKVIEVGGARPTTDSLRSDFFLFDNALVRLEDAQGIVNVSQWHLYQDYQIADQFQLYHVLDRKEEKNTFTDDGSAAGSDISYNSYADFYDDFFLSGTETNEQSTFTTLSNEVGIKGDLSSVFYRFYAKLRTVDWTYLLYDPVDRAVEEYLGGYARFSWRDKFAVTANLEYLLGEGYQFQGNLSSDLLSLKYTTKQYRVPFIFSDYFGNHHEWHNDFDAVITNQLEGQVNLDFKSFEIRPKLSLTSYTNFLYFDQNINPVQSSDAIISSIGGDFNLRIYNAKEEGIHLENELMATTVSGGAADFVRIPDLWYNGRLFWRGNWFNDLVPVEVGVDAHARSAYFANAFAPEIQQFYIQDDQEIFGYMATDFFMNMKIDKFFLGIKWTHFNQPQDDGYLVSPNYPGQPMAFDFIVRWMFFD